MFKKRCLPSWTEEIFTISKRITKECSIHKLTYDAREILEGSFHEEELQKMIKEDGMFRIESILRKKKRGRHVSAGKMERVPRKVQLLV